MRLVARGVRWLSNVCGVAAAVCLTAACLVMCEMVFVRYFLGTSTIWQTEFVLYAVVAATLIGSPYVLATRGHVNVDLFGSLLGPRVRRVQLILAACLGIAFCCVLAWSGWRYFYEAWTEGWVTESVWAPPLWLVLLPLPIGLGTLTLQYVVDIVCLIAGVESPHRGEPAPERSA
jgi:TRAP-type C4-dicarboxylate transport system permease small subunit